jgi:hypothetical protein
MSQAGRERPPAPQADALSRQLISWLFGTSTWPEAGAAFGPLQYCIIPPTGYLFDNIFFSTAIEMLGGSGSSWTLN